MSFIQFSCKTLVLLTIFSNAFVCLILAGDVHNIEKRQIGVLARTGALPQGKRSVEVLARNGELPHISGKKEANEEDVEDMLIEELERAENLSKLRAQALAEKVFREKESLLDGTAKRSVAALARNGELPQKRLSETLTRSGYLIRPSQETAQSPPDLLDPDDFLAKGQSSVIPEFLDERSFRPFLSTAKRSLGSARNLFPDFFDKRNLGSLARDGGFDSLRKQSSKDRRAEYDGEWSMTKREVAGPCGAQDWHLATKALDRGEVGRKKRDFDYEDGEGSSIEKRFLGRIPQLGRIHQKVQSPSSRRRPHLRPNWL